jgi:superfamily II DNA or RNA helicase
MHLRTYQQAAVDSAITHLANGHNPVLQLATGTGKSLIIAALADYYKAHGKRTWVLTHVQQLVKQNAETYIKFTASSYGIICAGLNRKDLDEEVVFGSIQSMMGVLPFIKPPDLIIIDEAHRVPHNEGEPTLYETILRRYPAAQRVAMTATPWRMDNGIIYGSGPEFFFDKLAYNYTVPRAVADKWLCPLVGVETAFQLDLEDVAVQGDFVQTEADEAQTELWLESVARCILQLAGKRQHIAVYCPTVAAAQRTARIITAQTGWTVDVLHGGMSQTIREMVFDDFFAGHSRVLCSVDMITTGFDFPALDCIVCLRPTLSSSLWVQIQGRGTRLHDSKKNCLVLDFVGNLQRLGGVDMYETYYRQQLDEMLPEEVPAVPTKPYVKKERKVYPGVRTIKAIDPMTGREATEDSLLTVTVSNVNCVAIKTRRNPIHPVLLVQYACVTAEGARIDAATFIDTEKPTPQAIEFFKRRSLAVNLPSPARSLGWQMKGARQPATITVRKSGRYWNVINEHFNGES